MNKGSWLKYDTACDFYKLLFYWIKTCIIYYKFRKNWSNIIVTCLDGWTTDDLVFLWKEGDPVQVVKNLHLPRFTLEKFLTDYCNSKTNTGTEVSPSDCNTDIEDKKKTE